MNLKDFESRTNPDCLCGRDVDPVTSARSEYAAQLTDLLLEPEHLTDEHDISYSPKMKVTWREPFQYSHCIALL